MKLNELRILQEMQLKVMDHVIHELRTLVQ